MPASCSGCLWRQALDHCSMGRLHCSDKGAAIVSQLQQALLLSRCRVLEDRRQAGQAVIGKASDLSQHGTVPACGVSVQLLNAVWPDLALSS